MADLLCAAGVPVRAAVHDAGATPAHAVGSVDPVRFDWQDAATWEPTFSGARSIFVLRPPHLSKPTTQMVPALEFAKGAGVEHMVLLSLQGADRNRIVPHAALER